MLYAEGDTGAALAEVGYWLVLPFVVPHFHVSCIQMDCARSFADSLLRDLNIDQLPCVKVFRRGIPREFRGALDSASAVLAHVQLDWLPTVQIASTAAQLEDIASSASVTNPCFAGIFADEQLEALENFRLAADQLRG